MATKRQLYANGDSSSQVGTIVPVMNGQPWNRKRSPYKTGGRSLEVQVNGQAVPNVINLARLH